MQKVGFLLVVLLQSQSVLSSDERNVSVVYKSIFGGSTWWVGWNENGVLDSLQPRLLEGNPNPVQAHLKVTYLPKRPFGDQATRRRLTLTLESKGAQPEVLDFLVWSNTTRDPSVVVLDPVTEKSIDNASFCALKVCMLRFTIDDRTVVLHERFISDFKHRQISVSITQTEGYLFEWFARHVRIVTLSTILKKVE